MADEITEAKNTPCRHQDRQKRLVDEEFKHTRKRLARAGVVAVVQFSVYAFDCPKENHPEAEGNPFHCDFASMGSDVAVPNGLQFAIEAAESLLAALKAKLQ